ncbi:MAG TPA: chemotaxis protein CheW [Edaphobacter sp.]
MQIPDISTQTTKPVVADGIATDKRAGKYLVFQLGKEEFGAGVMKIREIMKMQEITTVPQTLPFVEGVINLRGRVIPVIDLRTKFGLERQEHTERTCIIVVRTQSPEGELPMGIIVDGVVEVLTLHSSDIEDTPDFGRGGTNPCLLGMAKIKGRVKILLDMDEVLSNQELQGISSMLQ